MFKGAVAFSRMCPFESCVDIDLVGYIVTFGYEAIEQSVKSTRISIERILSLDRMSPLAGWYDQSKNAWVMVVQGKGRLEIDDGATVDLSPGDHINIPAHKKHRVAWTDSNAVLASAAP